MKKIIILLSLFLVTQVAFAVPNTKVLDNIENSLYGFTYSSESENTRLDRLEKSVYGKTNSGQNQTRIAKLKKDLAADQMGQEIEPREDTFAEPEDSWVYSKEPVEAPEGTEATPTEPSDIITVVSSVGFPLESIISLAFTDFIFKLISISRI